MLPGIAASTWSGLGITALPFWAIGTLIGLANRSSGDVEVTVVAAALWAIGAAFLGLFFLLSRMRSRKEVAAGYTTVFKRRGVPRVDPRTGLVLYSADDPDPESAEWREIRAHARAVRQSGVRATRVSR